MTKNKGYEIDHMENTITVTKAFAKAAGILNTLEYKEMRQLREENPSMKIVLREIKKKDHKNSFHNLTYKNMEIFIKAKEGENSETLAELKMVRKLSKVQKGSYAYVKTWFLKKYPNYQEAVEGQEEETAEESKSQGNVVSMVQG